MVPKAVQGLRLLSFMDNVGVCRYSMVFACAQHTGGCGGAYKIKIGVSGKIISAFDIARMLALGADWCNSARGLCLRWAVSNRVPAIPTNAQLGCHQDPIVKGHYIFLTRPTAVYNFHKNTLKSLAAIVGCGGFTPPKKIYKRIISQTAGKWAD